MEPSLTNNQKIVLEALEDSGAATRRIQHFI